VRKSEKGAQEPSLKSLEEFHIWAARHMAGKMPTTNSDEMWTYPSSRDVIKAMGLQTIYHYTGVCQETIAASLWTDPYLHSVRMGKGRGDQCVVHFGGSSLCQSTSRSHCRGTKKTRFMILKFVEDNLFGWATCMGSP
jgi:hypothetical protein